MRRTIFLLLPLLLAAFSARAASLDIAIEIPNLEVAEYHRPYVAVWLETPDHEVAANLAVWYDTDGNGEDGATWLKDLRQWWRRSGRGAELPIDGVTGATRPAGQHLLHFDQGNSPLGTLAAGKYILVVEAVREVGGREVLRLPFAWPVAAPKHLSVQGERELGLVTLDLNP